MHESARRPSPAQAAPVVERPPACPVCNGAMVLLRNVVRCNRCRYLLCVGCDADADVEGEGGRAAD
jgi:hypothetical protein